MRNIDWNQMWANSKKFECSDDLDFWNDFAATFTKKTEEPDIYMEQFYEKMAPGFGETLFDMGCGAGTLAVPFAEKGHEIWAADFSPAMLDCMMEYAAEKGVAERIHPILLDWNEDWSIRNLPVCDIAFSSRSLICDDMSAALTNLESVARRRVCMGVWDTPMPNYDRKVASAIDYKRPGIGPHYMVMGELLERDVYPELSYIYSPAKMGKYETKDEAIEKQKAAFVHMTEAQEKMLLEYIDEHLIYLDQPVSYHGKTLDGCWQFDHKKTGSMAFISWNK